MISDINSQQADFKYRDKLRVKYKDMKKFMIYKGFKETRYASSTHVMYKNNEGLSVPVPNKKGTMAQGTVSKILKQINSNRIELAQFLYK